MVTASDLMTWEEFLALPDDGMERELNRGILVEKHWQPRDRRHGACAARICTAFSVWQNARVDDRSEVVSRAGFRLSRNPDTLVSLDIAYVNAEVAVQDRDLDFFTGPPVLAVEILSPWDTQEAIDEKIDIYLKTGVAVVWIVNTRSKTVSVYRPDADPSLFHEGQVIDAEPHLPGFRAEVKSFF